MVNDFKCGLYQHWKGNFYLALMLAREDETDEPVVVYVRLYHRDGLPASTRKLKIWNEAILNDDGKYVPRFKYIGQMT